MSLAEGVATPFLVGTKPPPEKQLGLLQMLFNRPSNEFETIPRIAYEKPVWVWKSIFGTNVIVSDPAGAKRVLLDNVANYPKTDMERKMLGAIVGEGLLVSDGDKWRSHRRLMAPSFDFRSIVSYAPAMVASADQFCEQWAAKGMGAVIDVAEEMTHLTLKVISETMFSSDGEMLGQLIDRSLNKLTDAIDFGVADLLPLIGPPRMKKKMERIHQNFTEMDATMKNLIAARQKMEGSAPRDLLDRLIAARDGEANTQLSNDEVRDELVIIFLAGHDTTALALTYTWYLLSQHPEVEAKMHEELQRVLGGRNPVHDDLVNLPYTKMVLEESMRLYPPAPGLSNRAVLEDDEICGVKVPKGAQVGVIPWVIHRHRLLWDNPEKFDPERFSPERSQGRHRFAYLPFGGGPRVCIGMALAMAEAHLILAAMAQRFRLKLVSGQDIVLQHRITMRPRDGIKMILSPRGA
ncbi:MAG: cytochrome P450 [Alphaproteobacteria bacterium]|nr:cytochrome P450 [Alphaproteobacteria bacterium]MBL6939132.1 cytochrome P450 [Alphaproteobacteria bacterium]MBL7096648.1 cytochrome P450 [Alphaproteobacteria bacterium]